jgi:GMP synthase (glutamine-hydrolysing)
MNAFPRPSTFAQSTRPAAPILVVLHQENSTTGRVGRLLRERGHVLDARFPRYGDALPPSLSEHAGAIYFGGPMSANDNDDFVRREIDWINIPLREEKPFLGICLGAQMLARHLGAHVSPDSQARVERGYYRVEATDHGDALCDKPFPSHVYQWHREGFDLPAGATLLARGAAFPHQAFRHGSALGLQFHPEVTFAMMCRWTTKESEQLADPGALNCHSHKTQWFEFDAAIDAWVSELLKAWFPKASTLDEGLVFSRIKSPSTATL